MIIVIRGLPGSGKTTKAHGIEGELGCEAIHLDNLMPKPDPDGCAKCSSCYKCTDMHCPVWERLKTIAMHRAIAKVKSSHHGNSIVEGVLNGDIEWFVNELKLIDNDVLVVALCPTMDVLKARRPNRKGVLDIIPWTPFVGEKVIK